MATITHQLIASSKALTLMFRNARSLTLKCTQAEGYSFRQISMGDEQYPIECKTEFQFDMSLDQANRMLKLLLLLPEQPVVLSIREDDTYIGVKQIVI